MSVASVLLPVFVQVALIYAVLIALVRARRATKTDDPAGGRAPRATQLGANYVNQCELPVLFFVLVALALITRKTNFVFVGLEWVFVLSRLVHAAVHVTSNHVPFRGAAFMVGAVSLGFAWIWFAFGIVVAVAP